MDTLIKAEAIVSLYEGQNKRVAPIISGYRPTFAFIKSSRASGKVELIDEKELYPGKSCHANLFFSSAEFLGDEFHSGKTVLFYEGQEALGEAILTSVTYCSP